MTTNDHEQLLTTWGRKLDVLTFRAEQDLKTLRATLVAKYGEGGMLRKEGALLKESRQREASSDATI